MDRLYPIISQITLAFLVLSCSSPDSLIQEKPPNILLIISDDQAWNDYSFMGHSSIETPNIDQLSKESLTFTRGYVTAPLCSPSLATIISGLHPHQHGITGNDPVFEFEGKRYSQDWRIARHSSFAQLKHQFYQNTLLTQRLEALNYLSLQTGKWWLGSWEEGHFTHGMTHGDYTRDGRHGDDGLKIGREGLQEIYGFIDEAQEKEQPFLVWYAPFLPHSPHTPPKELEDKYLEIAPTPAIAKYWAMCEWFDQTCGELINFLERKQITEETLVVYVCDNGWIQDPERQNRYAPRSKRTPYEGGLRTPILFKWPGKISPKIDTSTLVSSIDIVPSIMAACGLEADGNLPGINLIDSTNWGNRKTIFAAAYDHDIQSVQEPTRSLQSRIGLEYPWKLIHPDSTNFKESSIELYNLEEDPLERRNLVKEYPEITEDLIDKINNWWIPRHSLQ